jgi:ubiquitin-like-conjugating enzyme ATG10
MDIENFPSLNKEEFAEACHHLDSQYCRATLGPLRRRWKLRLCHALDMSSLDGGAVTYVQIIRPIEIPADGHDDLVLELEGFTMADKSEEASFLTADKDMKDAEEGDEVGTIYSFVYFHFSYWL